MPQITIPTGTGPFSAQPAASAPTGTSGDYLGGKIGLFQVFPSSVPLFQLPPHGIVSSNREQDVPILRARLFELQQEEKQAALQAGAALTVGQLIKAIKGPVFFVKEGEPKVEQSPSLKEALERANRFETAERTRSVAVSAPAALSTALAGAADLGAIGSAAKYVKANSALDAQQQELDKLLAMVNEGTAVTIRQEQEELARARQVDGDDTASLSTPTTGQVDTLTGKLVAGPSDPIFIAQG